MAGDTAGGAHTVAWRRLQGLGPRRAALVRRAMAKKAAQLLLPALTSRASCRRSCSCDGHGRRKCGGGGGGGGSSGGGGDDCVNHASAHARARDLARAATPSSTPRQVEEGSGAGGCIASGGARTATSSAMSGHRKVSCASATLFFTYPSRQSLCHCRAFSSRRHIHTRCTRAGLSDAYTPPRHRQAGGRAGRHTWWPHGSV